jgi:hypothetical protein
VARIKFDAGLLCSLGVGANRKAGKKEGRARIYGIEQSRTPAAWITGAQRTAVTRK